MIHSCPWCGKSSEVELPEVPGTKELIDAQREKIAELELDLSMLQVAHEKALSDSTASQPIPVPDEALAQATADLIVAAATGQTTE